MAGDTNKGLALAVGLRVDKLQTAETDADEMQMDPSELQKRQRFFRTMLTVGTSVFAAAGIDFAGELISLAFPHELIPLFYGGASLFGAGTLTAALLYRLRQLP